MAEQHVTLEPLVEGASSGQIVARLNTLAKAIGAVPERCIQEDVGEELARSIIARLTDEILHGGPGDALHAVNLAISLMDKGEESGC